MSLRFLIFYTAVWEAVELQKWPGTAAGGSQGPPHWLLQGDASSWEKLLVSFRRILLCEFWFGTVLICFFSGNRFKTGWATGTAKAIRLWAGAVTGVGRAAVMAGTAALSAGMILQMKTLRTVRLNDHVSFSSPVWSSNTNLLLLLKTASFLLSTIIFSVIAGGSSHRHLISLATLCLYSVVCQFFKCFPSPFLKIMSFRILLLRLHFCLWNVNSSAFDFVNFFMF